MERLLQINIIGIHRRVLSPDEAPRASGLLHFFHPRPPPPPPLPSHPFFCLTTTTIATAVTTTITSRQRGYSPTMTTTVTPTPATSTSRRPTPASTTTPMPTTDARRSTPSRPSHHQCGTHTGLGERARELSFLLFAFFGIFPVVPGIVSRFVIVIRLHPAKRGLYSRALCPPPPCPQPSPATLLTPFLTLSPRLVSRSCRQSHVRTGCIESGLLLKRRILEK